jgi:hypothetical protein
MAPPGYRDILICDTRRAQQWQAGLTRAGLEVVLTETRGEDAEKGSWQVAVAERHESKARALVTDVLQGRAKLPAPPFFSAYGLQLFVAILMIAVLLLVIVR